MIRLVVYCDGMLNFETIQATIEKCRELGTDKDYQNFVRTFGSCFSGMRPVVYAHVRRAGFSGTGMKPDYFGIPLSKDEHDLQHQKHEAGLLRTKWPDVSREAAKDWFDNEAQRFRLLYIKHKGAKK
jgi:hypothetical protein